MSLTRSADGLADASGEAVPWLEETGSYFEYDPLKDDQIRFLELEPGLSPDPIRCRLFHLKRYEKHTYEVLSCDWRRLAKPKVPISLNGHTFDVPPEVWAALHRIRSETRSRFLWTDSICINQRFDSENRRANNAERNGQLSHLPDIYQNATRLLVWLGGAEDNSHLVFEFLDRCRNHSHINWCHYSGETKDAFYKLSKRSWFYRALSAQELSLSEEATILCGRHRCEWLDLMKCSSFPSTSDYYHPLGGPDGRTHLHHLDTISRAYRVRLRNLFCLNRHCQAEDPRDKIFGALMMNTNIHFDITIDYKQDIPQLFQKFTRKLIESSRDLDVLHWLGPNNCVDGLPSWVPDYNVVNPTGTLPRVFGMSATYSIHYPLTLIPGFEFRDGNILMLNGRFVEKVTQAAEELEAQDTTVPGSKEFSSVVSGWENLASSLNNKRFPQTIIDAFSDTLIGNDDADLLVENDNPPLVRKMRALSSSVATKFNVWYKHIQEHQIGKVCAKGSNFSKGQQQRWRESLDADSMWYSRRMEMTCYGRKFFITDKGSMGLAPPRTRESDDIVFFPGGKYPFILRARDNGTHELIGDCFLYDLDVFALFRDKAVSTQQFLLT
ncbi:heterokaryon incompatibility protein-domain-containing protein [Annulohypoxylon truncatum]|uniref:heterokaryon incompatibility protein-domain-containing protein n=1 Tax=Annulohypoxylon truncatum TaxID=327061 RepID=UPI002007D098|nr:heterokaryon incompatibility protein-domain-containing protein [Annulohypoxylon truncatum]KAI1213833.1 heterokaryon incompatibility protein-domain-containing protein [Annulohypoxylon truncatum]